MNHLIEVRKKKNGCFLFLFFLIQYEKKIMKKNRYIICILEFSNMSIDVVGDYFYYNL